MPEINNFKLMNLNIYNYKIKDTNKYCPVIYINYDPACWPRRKSLASSNLDRLCAVLASVLHSDSPQEPAKGQNGAAAADHAPTPKSATEPPKY